MATRFKSRHLVEVSIESKLGRISLAGTIAAGKGLSFSTMRVLGSYALAYIVRGSGRYVDDRGVNQKLAAGDLITVFPDIPHSYGPMAGETWDEIYVVFDGPVFDLWREKALLDDARPISRLEPVDYWSGRIETAIKSDDASAALSTVCRLQELLAEIWQHLDASGVSATDRAWLASAKLLLEEEVAWENFDLATIADRMSISYVGFRKKFARLSGESPGRYHMKTVIDRACRMMRSQDCTNRSVAERMGFCDEFHFSRRFKQLVGITPAQYRLQVARSLVGPINMRS